MQKRKLPRQQIRSPAGGCPLTYHAPKRPEELLDISLMSIECKCNIQKGHLQEARHMPFGGKKEDCLKARFLEQIECEFLHVFFMQHPFPLDV